MRRGPCAPCAPVHPQVGIRWRRLPWPGPLGSGSEGAGQPYSSVWCGPGQADRRVTATPTLGVSPKGVPRARPEAGQGRGQGSARGLTRTALYCRPLRAAAVALPPAEHTAGHVGRSPLALSVCSGPWGFASWANPLRLLLCRDLGEMISCQMNVLHTLFLAMLAAWQGRAAHTVVDFQRKV